MLCFKPGEQIKDDFFSVSDYITWQKEIRVIQTGVQTTIFRLYVLLATQSDIKQCDVAPLTFTDSQFSINRY